MPSPRVERYDEALTVWLGAEDDRAGAESEGDNNS